MRVILTDAQNEMIRECLELVEDNHRDAEILIGLFETADKVELTLDEESE
jgi:hypothetical protein